MIYAEMLRLDADVLLRETTEFAKQERWVTARLLARLAAVERRELYAPCGYSSMWDYCLGELQMSEESAGRRLWAARKCRDFPALFDALAEGRLHMTAVHTLAPHLRTDNVDELVAAATGRTKAQLLDWLACRFPRPAAPTIIRQVGPPTPPPSPMSTPASPSASPVAAAGGVVQVTSVAPVHDSHSLASVPVPSTAQDSRAVQVPLRARANVDPLNADQVKVQFTMSRGVLAKMRRAQDLLGHQVARDDVAALLEKLLDMALPALEQKKFAATERPRAPRRAASALPGEPAANPRTIPAQVKREVWKRDGGRCTFTSATGRRCACTRGLEYDHVKPVALGGGSTMENVRLLCHRHNQLEAERRLGAGFMRHKRDGARRGRAPARRTAMVTPARALGSAACTP